MTQLEYGLELEERVIAFIGKETLCDNLLLALSLDDKIYYLNYIARCYDVDIDDILNKL